MQMPHVANITDMAIMAVMPQPQIARDMGTGRIADSTARNRAYGTADNGARNSAEQQVVHTLTRAGGGGNKQKARCEYHSDQGSHGLYPPIDLVTAYSNARSAMAVPGDGKPRRLG